MALEADRWRLTVRGIVQGVGFRPFVYRLAIELGLTGWVNNTVLGVVIEVEGDRDRLVQFQTRLEQEPPPQARIETIAIQTQPLQHDPEFTIHTSPAAPGAALQITLLPDLATCDDCLRELNDPGDRRYRYPFLNCTNCGPRFSILRDLPYDRPHTTMRDFPLCSDCQAEYDNPLDRRFHAQPVACPVCGPRLSLTRGGGESIAQGEAAMDAAIERLRRGEILAVKGLGGFHLFADARNASAVSTLRQRKARPDKPFALMYPSVATIAQDCQLTELEIDLLTSAIAPIVLLEKRRDSRDQTSLIAPNVAPNVPDLGVMLPHSPLHHLLMQGLGFPVVATSANRSGEPLCIDGAQVLDVLGDVIDAVLDHDRPIARPLDDSITRVIRVDRTTQTDRVQVLRHGRGYAPSTLLIPDLPDLEDSQSSRSTAKLPILAVGAHLKNAIALSDGQRLILSQYIGDLDTPATIERLKTTIDDLLRLYRIRPSAIACDAHPDYVSTQIANQLAHKLTHSRIDQSSDASPINPIPVQHHHAHALACIAEHGLTAPTLAIAWDGTGYGLDGTVWGGEWLRVDRQDWQRVAHWRSFPLPGGDIAAREPRRSALGWLWSVFGADVWNLADLANLPTIAAFTTAEKPLLKVAINRGLNTPQTSSVGRMFDAVASLLGLHQRCSFEGQGAIAVEALARSVGVVKPYAVKILDDGQIDPDRPMIVDSSELLREIVRDCRDDVDRATIAARFQRTLVEAIAQVAQRLDLSEVVLTGGCFQNRVLTELTIHHLEREDFRNSTDEPIRVHIHQRIPPNDGGLAIGQILAAWRSMTANAANSANSGD